MAELPVEVPAGGTGRRRGGPSRVVAATAAVALISLAVATAGEGGRERASSSYSAGATGVGAYAELLSRFGHPIDRLRGDVDGLDPAATVVVLDAPELSTEELERLGRFVRAGGRLVAGGAGIDRWLGDVVDDPPSVGPDGVRAASPPAGGTASVAPEVAGIRRVRFAGSGSFAGPGAMEPLLAATAGDAVAAVAASVGEGRVVALSDTSALQNRLLGAADNAAFALLLAGEAGRPVAFAEGPHGYGPAVGIDALPGRWRMALGGLALAAVVWLAARGRRLGPPEDEARPLPPARRAYADALAGTLARTGRPREAAEPVFLRARRLVAERAVLPADADADDVRVAAVRLGLPPDEVDAVVGGPWLSAGGDEAVVLAAGRALARLSSGSEGTGR